MRHQKAGNKLGRDSSHRKALLRNMVTSLFRHEQLETTDAKAKQLRSVAEKMITLAKRGDLHARRQALAYINEKAITHRLFGELKDRYLDRNGGYTRIIKKTNRKGDGAPISIIQLLEEEDKKKGKKKSKPTSIKSKVKKETKKSGKMKAADLESEKTKEEQAEKRPVPVEAENDDL